MPARAHILVVEDEPRLRDLLRLYLERDGHAVTVVGDGRAAIEAVDAADTAPIDLVVLDLMLPGLGGEAVLEAIRAVGRHPGPHRLRQAHRRRADRRAADGRRRLPRQAVQPARADGARRRHPAADEPGGRGHRWRPASLSLGGRPRDDRPGQPALHARRRRRPGHGPPDPGRDRPAVRARARPGRGPVPRAAARRGHAAARTTCTTGSWTSTSRTCGASSATTPRTRGWSRRSRRWAIGWSRRGTRPERGVAPPVARVRGSGSSSGRSSSASSWSPGSWSTAWSAAGSRPSWKASSSSASTTPRRTSSDRLDRPVARPDASSAGSPRRSAARSGSSARTARPSYAFGKAPDGDVAHYTSPIEDAAARTLATLEADLPAAVSDRGFLPLFNATLLLAGLLSVIGIAVASAFVADRLTRPAPGRHRRRAPAGRRRPATRRATGGDDRESADLATAFNAMADRLGRSEMLRRRAASDIAHDLATPATVLESQLQAMVDGVVPADRENLEAARSAASALGSVVAEIERPRQRRGGAAPGPAGRGRPGRRGPRRRDGARRAPPRARGRPRGGGPGGRCA